MKCADRRTDSRQDMQPGGRRRYGQEIMATGRKSRDEDRGKWLQTGGHLNADEQQIVKWILSFLTLQQCLLTMLCSTLFSLTCLKGTQAKFLHNTSFMGSLKRNELFWCLGMIFVILYLCACWAFACEKHAEQLMSIKRMLSKRIHKVLRTCWACA